MSNQTKQEFLESMPDSNLDWAAQQIVSTFSSEQIMELSACFSKLDKALYKSWGKDMTLIELREAIEKAELFL